MFGIRPARECNCGSGEIGYELTDARGIYVAFVCEKCEGEVKKGYRPEIFTDGSYPCDEQIDEDY